MPCMDKTGTMMGGGPTKNEFCTETLNQLIRDGGAKTISWFKVNSQLQKVVNSASSAAQTNPFLSASLTIGVINPSLKATAIAISIFLY